MAKPPVNLNPLANHSYGQMPYGRGVVKGKQLGRPGLSDTEAERLRSLVQKLLVEEFNGNRTAFAKAIGRSQPAVTQLLSGSNRPSLETLKRVAKVARVPYTSLLDGYEPTPTRTVHYDPRYPAREQAIQMLIDGGEGDEQEIRDAADAVAVALSSDEDLPALAWLDDIRLKLRQLRRGGPKIPNRQLTLEDAQEQQGEATRRFEEALKGKKGRKKR